MHTRLHRFTAGALALAFMLSFGAPPQLFAQAAPTAAAPAGAPQDRWPRKFTINGNQLDVYTPQLDAWDGRTIEWHAAVSVTAPGAKEPTFGVVFSKAKTDVDKTTRLVELTDLEVTKVNFPSAAAANDTYLAMMRKAMLAKKSMTIALDRLEADLGDPPGEEEGRAAPLQNDPPAILFSNVPAILVLVDGEPAWRAVPNTDLQRVINTSPIVLKDKHRRALPPPLRRLDAARVARGPVEGRHALRPQSTSRRRSTRSSRREGRRPDDGRHARTTRRPASSSRRSRRAPVPVVYMETQPTELIVVGRPAQLRADPRHAAALRQRTRRAACSRTSTTRRRYVLIAGRWFSAPGHRRALDSTCRSTRLPQDFATDPRRQPDGEREGFRPRDAAGAGGGRRQQHPADLARPDRKRRSQRRSPSTASRS